MEKAATGLIPFAAFVCVNPCCPGTAHNRWQTMTTQSKTLLQAEYESILAPMLRAEPADGPHGSQLFPKNDGFAVELNPHLGEHGCMEQRARG